jgi:4-diphosphocytidyl-2-C-methyl-D-erythritol kinase
VYCLSVPSFAKINWLLKVLGKRSDGYHEVVTILQTIDLCDQLRFEVSRSKTIEIETTGRNVAKGKDNLLFRAAHQLQQQAGVDRGVRIHLEKRIPVGAGLGGGSGNAAMALLCLNQLWDCGLSRRQLQKAGSVLGSDVPFFLLGGTVLARGRGELITCLDDVPPQPILLLYPELEMSTRNAYEMGAWEPLKALPDLTKKDVDTKILRFREAVKRGLSITRWVENDFDFPLMAYYPILAEAAGLLRNAGCRQVILSGSGSTLLGLADFDELESVARIITEQAVGEALLCRTLSRDRYRSILTDSGLSLQVQV